MVVYDVIFNVIVWILIQKLYFSSRRFANSKILEFWNMIPFHLKNSSPLILTNLGLRIESYIANLIWK
jgi:hypothetical protein